jgi:hypothetical protein
MKRLDDFLKAHPAQITPGTFTRFGEDKQFRVSAPDLHNASSIFKPQNSQLTTRGRVLLESWQSYPQVCACLSNAKIQQVAVQIIHISQAINSSEHRWCAVLCCAVLCCRHP